LKWYKTDSCMEVLELKRQIHDAIDLEDDEERLQDLYDWMVTSHPILSESDKSELIDMATNPHNYQWHTHDEVQAKLQKWRVK
jgi:hypothetical protein